MTKFKSILLMLIVALPTLLWPTVLHAEPAAPNDTSCLYPSPTDRFGVTVIPDLPLVLFDVTPLAAGRYLNWRAGLSPLQPSGMRYYQMINLSENSYDPKGEALKQIVRANPGSVWIIGNESDVFSQDNVTPEAYARHFHDAYMDIKSTDPTARLVSNGLVQVSRLRLAWLDRVWSAYRTLYGTDIPVDIWNTHTYIANEMHQEWGFGIPPGIPNAVGYTLYYGTQWRVASDSGASGGTVHESRTTDAYAWFAFYGTSVTLYLRTGPSSGIASVYLDHSDTPVAEVDLYAATPGTITRSYTNLPRGTGLSDDRHNIRARVTGRKNAASSGTWVRVDAISAPSTANLPGGRFEDNDPLQARIVTSVDDHDNLDMIVQQIRDFRQWLADHGQRNKPLINTEYGILMPADVGFDYPRVRTFMLGSFDRFVNDLVDPNLGYPADGNRLLQEWFWWGLAVDQFEGRAANSGLYNGRTFAIKPLGMDFANYVAPLKRDYRDMEAYSLALTPSWPLFAGDPSLINLKAVVRNLGNRSTGPFQVTARLGNGTQITNWTVPNLVKRFEPGHSQELSYNWQTVITSNRTLRIIVDEPDQIVEPCDNSNNTRSVQLVAPISIDLALSNPTTVPALLPPIAPGATTTVTLKVDLANLGIVGTSAGEITVKFWNGDPSAGGTLIGSQVFTPGNVTLPAAASVAWSNRSPGIYNVHVTVDPVSEESNLQNNHLQFRFTLPVGVAFFPIAPHRSGGTLEESHPALSAPAKSLGTWLLP